MKLTEMTDPEFAAICDAAVDIQYLIVKDGGMATKTAVEDVLMARYELDRADAHTIVNHVESRRDFVIGGGQVRWIATRPEPQPVTSDTADIIITTLDSLPGLLLGW